MLATIGDAEDVVQEAWLRWDAADRDAIASPDAWLTTVTTRLALDRLKSVRRRREQYPGPWLPEPVVRESGPEDAAELADSLTLGFLTLLDRLGPVERAVFLLADVFGMPYAEVADAVGKTEVACRQIASRSRRRLQGTHSRKPTVDERRIVDQLLVAMALGDLSAVLQCLAPDAVLISDGGPHRRAARRPVVGADWVARFCIKVTRKAYDSPRVVSAAGNGPRVVPAAINGDPGVIVYSGDEIDSVLAFEVDTSGDQVAAIWIVRAPEKLDHVLVPVSML
jgi:RNA polymerase sigma-70 factor (ECF subfamily)